ncbi:MAG: hypothetical protein DMF92_02240 [Acidobacteria bacterium]|nr:MAG: hypothetical protein DMF92_02240 [Acidobacteriota bacterium]
MGSSLIGLNAASAAAVIVATVIGGQTAPLSAATTENLRSTAIDYPGATSTVARGINDSGQIVGTYSCSAACTRPDTGEVSAAGGHGFLLDNGVYTRIDVPAAGASATTARGISVQGTIVGHYNVGGVTHGFTYSPADGTWVYPIDVPADRFDHPSATLRNTLVINMSPQGYLVGCFHEDSQTMTTMHGWVGRLQRDRDLDDFAVLATIHDPDTMNNGVAATGRIAGFYLSEGVSYIADENGIITTFTFDGNLFTLAWANNARGDVVGVHGDNPANTVGSPVHPRGFLRDGHGDFRDLAVPNATVTQVFGVNDARDVVGSYTDAASKTHGFVARLGNQGNR